MGNHDTETSSARSEKRLQLITVTVVIYSLMCGFFYSLYFTVRLPLVNSRWIKICYVTYMTFFFYDRNTPWRGGRSGMFAQKLRKWRIWKHFANYFPIKLIKTVDLDPSRNYIFCGFPHGLWAFGYATIFAVNGTDCDNVFPGLEFRILTLNFFFLVPFFREFCLAFGGCSCSKESIKTLLTTKPKTGKQSRALVLLPGGAQDCFNTRPGLYRIVLKNRKGFVREALRTGTPLVPVFSFGDTDCYSMWYPLKDSLEGKLRSLFLRMFGVYPIKVVKGTLLRNFFNLVPKRTPIHVVVGSPIELPKIEDPLEEEVDKYHQIFTEKLIELFDSYKNTYSKVSDYGNLTLNLV